MVTWGVRGATGDDEGGPMAANTEESGLSMLRGQLQGCDEGATEPIPRATATEYTGRTATLRLPGTDPAVIA